MSWSCVDRALMSVTSRGLVVGDDVAVDHLRVAFEGHGIFVALKAFAQEAALLRRPLVEDYIVGLAVLETVGPLVVAVHVAQYFGIYSHIVKAIGGISEIGLIGPIGRISPIRPIE